MVPVPIEIHASSDSNMCDVRLNTILEVFVEQYAHNDVALKGFINSVNRLCVSGHPAFKKVPTQNAKNKLAPLFMAIYKNVNVLHKNPGWQTYLRFKIYLHLTKALFANLSAFYNNEMSPESIKKVLEGAINIFKIFRQYMHGYYPLSNDWKINLTYLIEERFHRKFKSPLGSFIHMLHVINHLKSHVNVVIEVNVLNKSVVHLLGKNILSFNHAQASGLLCTIGKLSNELNGQVNIKLFGAVLDKLDVNKNDLSQLAQAIFGISLLIFDKKIADNVSNNEKLSDLIVRASQLVVQSKMGNNSHMLDVAQLTQSLVLMKLYKKPSFNKIYRSMKDCLLRYKRDEESLVDDPRHRFLHNYCGLKKLDCRVEFMVLAWPVDLYIKKYKLVVELDGYQHLSPKSQAANERRDKALEDQGYRVVHIKSLTETDIDAILEPLKAVLAEYGKNGVSQGPNMWKIAGELNSSPGSSSSFQF